VERVFGAERRVRRRRDRNGNGNVRCERRVDRDKREMLPAKTVVDLLRGFSVFRVAPFSVTAAAAPRVVAVAAASPLPPPFSSCAVGLGSEKPRFRG
jgi:hypothetical protein